MEERERKISREVEKREEKSVTEHKSKLNSPPFTIRLIHSWNITNCRQWDMNDNILEIK